MENRGNIAELYFLLNIPYDEILVLLAANHGCVISRRTLHRILRERNCYRRRNTSDLGTVIAFVQQLLNESEALHGYRWMHLRCLQQGLVISRDDVRVMISILDSAGVAARTARRLRRREYFSKGPNYIWHFDGYDKLKPYGLCVSGCIDGYSRYIIWLKVYKTNNDPKVISGYYMECVRERMGAPTKIRADRGTENGHVAAMQTLLVGTDSFLYGRSTANQRIESWWGVLRRQCGQFWMNCLETLKDHGLFSGDILDKGLVQFCFTALLQVSRYIIATNLIRCLGFRI